MGLLAFLLMFILNRLQAEASSAKSTLLLPLTHQAELPGVKRLCSIGLFHDKVSRNRISCMSPTDSLE